MKTNLKEIKEQIHPGDRNLKNFEMKSFNRRNVTIAGAVTLAALSLSRCGGRRSTKQILPSGAADKPHLKHVRDFINKYSPLAVRIERQYNIPAEVVLGQAAIETGWGRHVKGNSFFGIKGSGQKFRTTEYENGKKTSKLCSFEAYQSPEESFDAYGQFLSENDRYDKAFKHNGTPEKFIKEIAKAGYATDPEYSGKVISIINKYFICET